MSAARSTWGRFVAIATPFFRSELRAQGLLRLALLLALLLGVSALNVVNSFVGRDFMTAIEQRQASAFFGLALVYVGVFAASTLVALFQRFTEQHLGLLWRQWLTGYLTDRYLSHRAYYSINAHGHVDNPDQRIAEDVRSFTTTSTFTRSSRRRRSPTSAPATTSTCGSITTCCWNWTCTGPGT